MTPTSAHKRGARYRYYTSCVLAQDRKGEAGSRSRVPAPELEARVLRALREAIGASEEAEKRLLALPAGELAAKIDIPLSGPSMAAAVDADGATLIEANVARVVVGREQIVWRPGPDGTEAAPLVIPWPAPASRRRGVVHAPKGDVRPIRSETRARLLQNIADARAWLGELVSGRAPEVRTIAERERFSERHVRTTLHLALLAPDIVKAALDGTLPDGVGVTRLGDVRMSWAEQRATLRLGRGTDPRSG